MSTFLSALHQQKIKLVTRFLVSISLMDYLNALIVVSVVTLSMYLGDAPGVSNKIDSGMEKLKLKEKE